MADFFIISSKWQLAAKKKLTFTDGFYSFNVTSTFDFWILIDLLQDSFYLTRF